ERIISRALEKDRDERYQEAKDLLADLKSLKQDLDSRAQRGSSRQSHSSGKAAPIISTRRRRRANSLIALMAGAAVVIGGSAWLYLSRNPSDPPLPPMKLVPFTSFRGEEFLPAFSPDGNQIAFALNGEPGGDSQAPHASIWVKQVGFETPHQITSDSHNDFSPVWSPDGQRIAFLRLTEAEMAIYIVSALGGAERKLLTLGPNL